MEGGAAEQAAMQTSSLVAQPAMGAELQYTLTIYPRIPYYLNIKTASEPTTQLRALAEAAAKEKCMEILLAADAHAIMKAAAGDAALASAPGIARPTASGTTPIPLLQPQPAMAAAYQHPLQLIFDLDLPSMTIPLALDAGRTARDAAEDAASAAGKQLLRKEQNVAAIVASVSQAVTSSPVAAVAAAAPPHMVPHQLYSPAAPALPAAVAAPVKQVQQVGPNDLPAALPSDAQQLPSASAAAVPEQQEQNATSQAAAAESEPQHRPKQHTAQLADAQEDPEQVAVQKQSNRRPSGVGTRKTSSAAANTPANAAAVSPATGKRYERRRKSAAAAEVPSSQVVQQDTVPAAAMQPSPVKSRTATRSKTAGAHEQQQQQQQQPSGPSGAARNRSKRGRGQQDAAAVAGDGQSPSTRSKRTRTSQPAGEEVAAVDDGDEPMQQQQQDELPAGQILLTYADQQQQQEPSAAVSGKAQSGKAKGRGKSRTSAAAPAPQEAAAEAVEPEQPADAALAVATAADQDKSGGNRKKRCRASAPAAVADDQVTDSGAATGSEQQASVSAGRRGGTRRPLVQTQPPAPSAAAAGSNAEAAAAADNRLLKKLRKSQQEQEQRQAAKQQTSTARGRSSQQPAGSGGASHMTSQTSGLSAAAAVAPGQRAAAQLTEKEAAFQKAAAAAEYPVGWKPFPDSSKDKAESSAAATAADKELKEKEREFAAAVAAANLPCLAPGPGQLRQDTQSGCYRKDIPDLSVYRLGDHTGHHSKLWRKTVHEDGSVYWEQLSTSCHDCQHQHVRWECPDPQHALTAGSSRASFCNKCLHIRYRRTSYCLAALHQSCPRCRGMCTCKSCLRQPDHAGRVMTGGYSAEELRNMGGYVLKFVGPLLKGWLQLQEVEAALGGYENLSLVPVEQLNDEERMNCDRCGTNLVGLFAHCSAEDCQWDICHTCMSELRQQQQQQPQQAPIETDQQFQWTCCNPKCSSAVKAIKQQSKPQQQQQQQGQQGDKHVSQAGAGPSSNPAAPVEAAVDDTAQSPGSRQRRKSAKQLECEETDRLLHHVSADPADAADDTAVEAAVSAAVQSRRCAAAGHSVHGDELHCVRGAAELQLKFMLPADLLQDDKEAGSSSTAAVLEQLRKIAEAHGDFELNQLLLSDCPYLPPGAPLKPATAAGSAAADGGIVIASSAALGAARDFTLSDLMSDSWWKVLPDGLRDIWRRKANSSVYLFTPGAKDLDWPVAGDAAAVDAAAIGRVTLARLVFWGRWLVRDPIIVRGLKGRIPWDPETMARAMKNFNASEETVTVMDCADFHKIDGVKAATFFRGYVEGFWRKSDGARSRMVNKDTTGAEPAMLKVKDWPPADDFRKELPRHFMDFIERLSTRYYTDPRLGRAPLNLATCLTKSDNPTDLGPKGYLAYGRWEEAEAEGDSVTKMHLDMTDAVNLLVDKQPGGDAVARQRAAAAPAAAAAIEGGETSAAVAPAPAAAAAVEGGQASAAVAPAPAAAAAVEGGQASAAVALAPAAAAATEGGAANSLAIVAVDNQCVRCGDAEPSKPGYDGAGAVWDIVHRNEVAAVDYFLSSNAKDFIHQGAPVNPSTCSAAFKNPVLSQYFMLVESHRQKLKTFLPERPVEMLHFEQHLDEGVYIPGGCPHQVRNLQSCTKVAVDYVSPEALKDCLAQRLKLRELDLWCGEPVKEEEGQRIVPSERDYAEKLQSQLIMVRAALTAAGLTAEPQVMPSNVEPELPEVAADARVTRMVAQPAAVTGRAGSASVATGAGPAGAAAAGSVSAPDSGVQGEGAGTSSGRRRAGSGARSADSTAAGGGRGRGQGRGRGRGAKKL